MSGYPISIKGVLVDGARVLLLRNARGEWDLPGGRPDPGEDFPSALKREMREETGLDAVIGQCLGEHLFEVLPGAFVRIVAYACRLAGPPTVTISHEHLDIRWVSRDDLAEMIAGYPLPAGYLGAIRQAISQPPAPSVRTV